MLWSSRSPPGAEVALMYNYERRVALLIKNNVEHWPECSCIFLATQRAISDPGGALQGHIISLAPLRQFSSSYSTYGKIPKPHIDSIPAKDRRLPYNQASPCYFFWLRTYFTIRMAIITFSIVAMRSALMSMIR